MIDKSRLTEEQKQMIINSALKGMEEVCDKVVCPYCGKTKVWNNPKNEKDSFFLGNGHCLHCGECKRDFKFNHSDKCYENGYFQGARDTERKILEKLGLDISLGELEDHQNCV